MDETVSQVIGAPLWANGAHFGTDGIRGNVEKVLSPAIALQIGYWFGQILQQEGPVLIGMDSRLSGMMLTSALTAGLTAVGRDVWHIGICPTPAIPNLIKTINAAGGLMVSASHNPPEDNGIKFFEGNGQKLLSSQQQVIESGLRGEINKAINTKSRNPYGIASNRSELMASYKKDLLNFLTTTNLEKVSIVLDLCWGSATSCAQEVFEELGANLTLLHNKPDGRYINVGCGSTSLQPLQKAVIETGASMGFAFDGDADRVLAVDGHGRTIDGDHVLFLWGSELKEKGNLPKNLLVATVMSNLGFEKAWIAKGGLLERTPVGDQNVYSAMLKSGAALGGEQSGHILSTTNGLCGDGLLTALQLATICKSKNISLTEWLNESFQPYPQKLINVPIKNKEVLKNWETCEPLADALSITQSKMGSEGRILIRASGTEPLLRIMVEASDKKLVESSSIYLAKIAQKHLCY